MHRIEKKSRAPASVVEVAEPPQLIEPVRGGLDGLRGERGRPMRGAGALELAFEVPRELGDELGVLRRAIALLAGVLAEV